MSNIASLMTQGGLFTALYGRSGTGDAGEATAAASPTLPTTTKTTTSDAVSISRSAAEKADNAKDFAALAKEVRTTLDTQYAAAEKKGEDDPAPDLSGMTGRALAAIALDKDHRFSATEVAAARTRLRDETRSSFADAVGQGTYGRTAIAAYSKQLVASYDAMSSEERQARGWTARFRTANEAVVTTAATSLFDQIGNV